MIAHVGVVVPAADEQDRIGACLDALLAAVDRLAAAAPGIGVDLLVVLDGCRDRTAEVVAGYGRVRAIGTPGRCVGAARQAGAEEVLGAAPVPPEQLWHAATDADSRVPADWLTTQLRCADAGADLVLGTVLPDGPLSAAALAAWHRRHRLVDGHPHVHGANLGIRGVALRRLGGWPRLRTGEDVALAARALAAGLAITRTAAAPVHTSARADGRAPEGFSSYLRALPETEPA